MTLQVGRQGDTCGGAKPETSGQGAGCDGSWRLGGVYSVPDRLALRAQALGTGTTRIPHAVSLVCSLSQQVADPALKARHAGYHDRCRLCSGH